jgi:hypothetical protein
MRGRVYLERGRPVVIPAAGEQLTLRPFGRADDDRATVDVCPSPRYL